MVIDTLLVLIACVVLVPVLVITVQVLFAIKRTVHVTQELNSALPSIALLVPAHNEEAVIASTLATLVPQLGKNDRILVVADNCTDDTAAIVRAAGVEVIERNDSENRGKGYALDFGVKHLKKDSPEILIVVDADCQAEAGAIEKLAVCCIETARPVQALYLMHAPDNTGLKLRIAEFAWLVKNFVRPLGFSHLGLPCQLMGTGMAFPWALIQEMNLASSHIVEDMKLGVDMAIAGSPPVFCPNAVVKSYFPIDGDAVVSQRTRWEHGHLSVILHEFPRLFLTGIFRINWLLIAMALDLIVPPLSLLAGILVLFFVVTMISVALGLSTIPLQLAIVALVLFGIAIAISWQGRGKSIVTLMELLTVPIYVLRKIPIYLKFFVRRQKEWIKTDRK